MWEMKPSKRLVYHTKKEIEAAKAALTMIKCLWQNEIGKRNQEGFQISTWFLIYVHWNVNKIPKVIQDRFNLKLIKGNWAAETAAWKQRWRNKKVESKNKCMFIIVIPTYCLFIYVYLTYLAARLHAACWTSSSHHSERLDKKIQPLHF